MRGFQFVALAAASALTAPTLGQFGMGGLSEAFRPAFTTRDVQLAVDMLDLDEAQQFVLETLYEDYESEFFTGFNAFQERMKSMRSELDPTTADRGKILQVVFAGVDEWREQGRQLADQFVLDLKGLLSDDQAASWPAFERKLFRLKYLKNGQLPAENLDLVTEVRDLELGPAEVEALDPIVLEYEMALHEALRQRELHLAQSQTDVINAIQEEDYDLALNAADKEIELRKRVRDINEQYTTTLAAALPEKTGQDLAKRIKQRAYPRVYRVTPAERMFEAALKLDDISPETREAIVGVQLQFMTELDVFNERLVSLLREHEPKQIRRNIEQVAERLKGASSEREPDPLRDEFTQRRDLATRFVEQLQGLLTPEQFAALPGAKRWAEPEDEEALAGEGEKRINPATERKIKAINARGEAEAGPGGDAEEGEDGSVTPGSGRQPSDKQAGRQP